MPDFSPTNSVGQDKDIILELKDVQMPVIHSLFNEPNGFILKMTSNDIDFSHKKIKNPLEIESQRKTSNLKKQSIFNLSKLFLLKKFVGKLKSITSSRVPLFLGQNDFNIVNDLAFFFNIWKKRNNNKKEEIKNKLNNLWVLE